MLILEDLTKYEKLVLAYMHSHRGRINKAELADLFLDSLCDLEEMTEKGLLTQEQDDTLVFLVRGKELAKNA